MVHQELTMAAKSFARHYTYADFEVFALDFGATADPVTVDVVDGTAILVSETDPDNQFDLDLPDGDVDVTTNNGIVTITVYNSL